jgi:hypothetical protein
MAMAMKLPRFKSKDIFQGPYTMSPGFGWDAGDADCKKWDPDGKIWPRIHVANDYQSARLIHAPVDFYWTDLIDKDAQGCSVMRLCSELNGWDCTLEIRMLHINVREVDKVLVSNIRKHQIIKKGTIIAPTGNTGMSFGTNGGRHLHCLVLIIPKIYDEDMNCRFGNLWRKDDSEEMERKYGAPFLAQKKMRGITKINSFALWKYDAYWKREMMVLNISKIFD